jgi:hypothetical protein
MFNEINAPSMFNKIQAPFLDIEIQAPLPGIVLTIVCDEEMIWNLFTVLFMRSWRQ